MKHIFTSLVPFLSKSTTDMVRITKGLFVNKNGNYFIQHVQILCTENVIIHSHKIELQIPCNYHVFIEFH